MKVHLTLEQLVRILCERDELQSHRHSLAECLDHITSSIVFATENTSDREYKIKGHILECVAKLLETA